MKWAFFLLVLLCIPLVSAAEFVDEIDKYFLTSETFVWRPAHPGEIASIQIEGEIDGTGRVRVNLIKEGKQYLLYSRSGQVDDVVIEEFVELAEGTNIGLVLAYGDGTWDKDNDGLDGRGVDLKIEPIFFSFLNNDHLCTVWDVYNIAEEEYTPSCYGNVGCCNFLGYEARLASWDADFVAVKNGQGLGDQNIVLGRVVFFNGTKVSYSNVDALEVSFVSGEVSASVDELVGLYESQQNFLRVEVDNRTLFHLQRIRYITLEQGEELPEAPPEPEPVSAVEERVIIREPIITEENTSFSVHFDRLDEGHSFTLMNDLVVESIRVSSPLPLDDVDVTISGSEGTISVAAPPDVRVTLDLSLPLLLLENDLDNVQFTGGNPSYLRNDGVFAYYRVSLEGGSVLSITFGREEVVQEAEEKTSFFLPLLILLIAIVIVAIVIVVYGIRKSVYRDIAIGFDERRVRRVSRRVHRLRQKYEKL